MFKSGKSFKAPSYAFTKPSHATRVSSEDFTEPSYDFAEKTLTAPSYDFEEATDDSTAPSETYAFTKPSYAVRAPSDDDFTEPSHNFAGRTEDFAKPSHTVNPPSDAFQIALSDFTRRLTDKERRNFRFTSRKDVEATLAEIQRRQEAQRELRNLTRIRRFLEAMEQFGKVIEVFTNASDMVAFIWGPFKFLLQTSSTWATSLDKILEAYEQIGESLPLLQQYESFFRSYPEMQRVLVLMYKDILEFHRPAIRFFDRPTWKQVFRSVWSDFKTQFDGTLNNLTWHRQLIESQFNLLQARQHESDRSHLFREIEGLVRRLQQARSMLQAGEEKRKAEQLHAVQLWIAGYNPAILHEKTLKDREEYPETGLWVTKCDKIADWLNEDTPRSSTLWMHGIPGAGKTVLASIIIKACLGQHQFGHRTAYFYCRYDDTAASSCLSILKGLLLQQTHWYPNLLPYFNEQRQQKGEAVLTLEKTAKLLFDAVSREGGRQYIILDGLDECPKEERRSILLYLTSLIAKIDERVPSKLRLLVISQKEPDIKKLLINAEEFELRSDDNRQDIEIFVRAWAAKIQTKFELRDAAAVFLERRTCVLAAGQFLFAKLVMENMHSQPTLDMLLSELEESRFPKELSEAYDRIIERIKRTLSKPEWEVAQKFLGWMTCASRPLKWHEMQGAMSISVDDAEVDFTGGQARRHAHDLCGALVTECNDRVILVHHTAKRYISESEHVDILDIECKLASLCLQYLTFDCFNVEAASPEELRSNILNGSFAFADYAVAKWMNHFDRILSQADHLNHVDHFNKHEVVMQGLCEAVHELADTYSSDLTTSCAEAEVLPLDVRLNPEVCKLLASFEESEVDFQSLWTHVVLYRTRDSVKRNEISLDRLQNAMDTIRKTLEEILSGKPRDLAEETRIKLQSYYGQKMFRCSKLTCFYFHEGFTDGKIRDKHVRRHDRPFQCAVPDCTAADFGFGSKKDVENHMNAFHPDTEIKAQMFKEAKPLNPSHAKFGCGRCGKSFVRRSILKDHELTHTGQKPYDCKRCGKAFTRKNDCTRHEKIHDNR